ncbi:MAG: hypothetical protein DRP50_07920 [Thermotoga sp.]|nr:MAG: hypothetical protein DRP50_07920 [Thermotoga sp.]
MKRVLVILVIIVLLLLSEGCTTPHRPPSSLPPDKTTNEIVVVTVEGVGINEDDAVRDAAVKALQREVGFYLTGRTTVSNYRLLDKTVLTRTHGMILSQHIISTSRTPGSTIKAKVKFKISKKILEDNIYDIIMFMNKPRIMVVVPERHIGKPVPDPAGETAIIHNLLEKGFYVVDQKQVKAIRYSSMVRLAAQGDKEAAERLGAEFGADVIITGEAFSESGGELMGLQTARARVEARAIWAGTGEIIAADAVQKGSADLTAEIAGKKALKSAGDELAKYMMKKIIANWVTAVDNGMNCQLLITGIKNIDDYHVFIAAIKSLPGVREVYSRSFSKGIAKIDVTVIGTSQLLAQKIRRFVKLRNYAFDITNVSMSEMTLKFTRR